jgi:hypothetical protein
MFILVVGRVNIYPHYSETNNRVNKLHRDRLGTKQSIHNPRIVETRSRRSTFMTVCTSHGRNKHLAKESHHYLVEELKERRRRLVDGADDGAVQLADVLQQMNALLYGEVVQPSERTKRLKRNFRRVGVTHVVGSSRKMTGGLLTSSRATLNLLRWPPDRCSLRVSTHLSRPSRSTTSCTWNQNEADSEE